MFEPVERELPTTVSECSGWVESAPSMGSQRASALRSVRIRAESRGSARSMEARLDRDPAQTRFLFELLEHLRASVPERCRLGSSAVRSYDSVHAEPSSASISHQRV